MDRNRVHLNIFSFLKLDTVTVNFGNPTSDACPELIAPTVIPEPVEPWTIEPIYASPNVPMVAYIGSAGGRRGYQGIAGL